MRVTDRGVFAVDRQRLGVAADPARDDEATSVK